jgi:hypothetical protein
MFDQRLDFFGDHGSAGLPALTQPWPILPEPPLLPQEDRTGLHEGEGVLPPGPQAGEPSPEEPIHRLEARPGDRSLVDGELMAEARISSCID